MLPFPSAMMAAAASAAIAGGTIVVPAGAVTGDVASFPVYLDLADMPSSFWTSVSADGGNLRIKQAGTALAYDVIAIDTGAHTGKIRFKADLVTASANNFTYDFTGSALPAAGDALGRNAVWSRFNRVYSGTSNVDRTGNGAALTLVGNASFSGGVINFDGADDFAYVPCGVPANDFTIFLIGHLNGNVPGGGQHHVLASQATAGTGTPSYRASLIIRSTGNWACWDNTNSWLESGTAAVYNSDLTVAFKFDEGTARSIILNGVSIISGGTAFDGNEATPHFTLGGEDDTPATEFQGNYELACYALEALPNAFIIGMHKNRRDRASFYTIT